MPRDASTGHRVYACYAQLPPFGAVLHTAATHARIVLCLVALYRYSQSHEQ